VEAGAPEDAKANCAATDLEREYSESPPDMPAKVASVTKLMHVHSACASVEYKSEASDDSPASISASLEIDWTGSHPRTSEDSVWTHEDLPKLRPNLSHIYSHSDLVELEATRSVRCCARWRRGIVLLCITHTLLTTLLFWLCVNSEFAW